VADQDLVGFFECFVEQLTEHWRSGQQNLATLRNIDLNSGQARQQRSAEHPRKHWILRVLKVGHLQ
jgi:hypothetical protein